MKHVLYGYYFLTYPDVNNSNKLCVVISLKTVVAQIEKESRRGRLVIYASFFFII